MRAFRSGIARWKYQHEERREDDVQDMALALHEYCRVLRWRSGDAQGAAAKKVGVTRSRLNKMELGEIPCDQLLAYWEIDKEKLAEAEEVDETVHLTPNLSEI